MFMRPVLGLFLCWLCACAPRSVDRSVILDAGPAVERPGGSGGAGGASAMAGTGGSPDAQAIGGTAGTAPVDAAAPDVPSSEPPDAPASPPDSASGPVDAEPMQADLAPPVDVPPEAPVMRTALVVQGSPMTSTAGDQAIRAALESRNFTVTLAGDSGVTAGDATGKDLVVLAGSCSSMVLGGKFRTVTVPVLNLESGVMGALGMTATAETNFGEQAGTAVNVLGMHPLAAGLSGMVTVATSGANLNFAVPAMTAEIVATVPGMSNRAVIFAYPAGTQMVGLAAPATRVGLFAGESAAQRLTDAGKALLAAAIDWAVR